MKFYSGADAQRRQDEQRIGILLLVMAVLFCCVAVAGLIWYTYVIPILK